MTKLIDKKNYLKQKKTKNVKIKKKSHIESLKPVRLKPVKLAINQIN